MSVLVWDKRNMLVLHFSEKYMEYKGKTGLDGSPGPAKGLLFLQEGLALCQCRITSTTSTYTC